ncbi:hypothetical protein ACWV26_16430 [Rummeliibacillus sp. JY-2-4R]
MKSNKKKSPFFLDKPSGKLPKYKDEDDRLVNLNKKMKNKINEIKNRAN